METIVHHSRELKPLWDSLVSRQALCKDHTVYIEPLQTLPSHAPIIPFPHSTPLPTVGTTYTCSFPGLEQWAIHVVSPNHAVYEFPLFDMFVWMSMLNEHRRSCIANGLQVFIYPNKRPKKMPIANETLGSAHINSAYTYSCPEKGEIIIYRTEELFKVFLHETMHVAGYDFSGAPNNSTLLFGSHRVHTYESYAEFWARIWNLLFTQLAVSARWSAQSIARRILAEQEFAIQQLIRVMRHNHMHYFDLVTLSPHESGGYQEDTNVLAYYVGTAGLLARFQETLLWCRQHATVTKPLYVFTSSARNIQQFHTFLRKLLHSPTFLLYVDAHMRCTAATSLRMSAAANDKCSI